MGDTQTTKAAETTHVKQKTEDRPPHEREYAPSAFADATLFRATGSDDPTTPPQHLARVLRRLTTPHQRPVSSFNANATTGMPTYSG